MFLGQGLLRTSSAFHNNTALDPRGAGGALNLYQAETHTDSFVRRNMTISQSIFNGNLASFRGGAITTNAWPLQIMDSSFQSSPYFYNQGHFGRDFVYSSGSLTLENVSFKDFDNYNEQNSLILSVNKPHIGTHRQRKGIVLKGDVYITCLTGKNIEMFSQRKQHYHNRFDFLSVSCSVCPKNFYSLTAGKIKFFSTNRSSERKHAKCNPCPSGGKCNKGAIKAENNFWGFIHGGEIKFISCPFGYCCFEKECKHYFSCRTGRAGNLCGSCEKGLTENLFNANCLVHTRFM